MKIAFELEPEDALELGRLHMTFMAASVKMMGDYPLEYSNYARIVNAFEEQMVKQLTVEEVMKVKEKLQQELYGE